VDREIGDNVRGIWTPGKLDPAPRFDTMFTEKLGEFSLASLPLFS
jgi:hypothetical protein